MLRSQSWARWATCALAISICVPAVLSTATASAGKAPKKSLADCTSFEQNDKNDETVEIKINNSCSIPVDCSVSWRVVCAPESAKRRTVHAESKTFSLTEGTGQSTEASATVCGDDAWQLDSIKWGCEPNKD